MVQSNLMHDSDVECNIVDELAALPENALIPEKALAKIFSCSTTTIKRAVERGELPQPVRMFGKPSWTAGGILRHVNARLETAQKQHDDDMQRLAMYD